MNLNKASYGRKRPQTGDFIPLRNTSKMITPTGKSTLSQVRGQVYRISSKEQVTKEKQDVKRETSGKMSCYTGSCPTEEATESIEYMLRRRYKGTGLDAKRDPMAPGQ